MTRDQIESILRSSQAKADKEGGYAFGDGANVTIYVAHDGASLSFQKLESLRFEGDLVFAKSNKQTVAIVVADVFAVAVEGGVNPARRPAGFTAS